VCVCVIFQGIGTAIGELPPYFMAKAARLSGQVDEDEQDIEELIHGKDRHPTELVCFNLYYVCPISNNTIYLQASYDIYV